MSSDLSVGDRVVIGVTDASEIDRLQWNHGGWSRAMDECLTKPCKVIHLSESDALVHTASGETFRINRKLLIKYRKSKQFKLGDTVKIIENEQLFEQIMRYNGDVEDARKEIVGKNVIIVQIFDDGDYKVKYKNRIFIINERCISTFKSNLFRKDDQVQISSNHQRSVQLQHLHGGWFPFMKNFEGKIGKVHSVLITDDILVSIDGMHLIYNPQLLKLVHGKSESSDSDSDAQDAGVGQLEQLVMRLFLETELGNLEAVRHLVKIVGSNVKMQKTYPLLVATNRGHINIVEFLLESKAQINAKDDCGSTALHIAVVKKNVAIIRLLLEKGADINSQNNQKITPIMLAAFAGHKDILRLLIARKEANLNHRDFDNDTALHLATQKSEGDIVEMLLEAGSDPRATGNNQLIPFQIAAIRGDERILEIFLKKEGAPIANYVAGSQLPALHILIINNHVKCLNLFIKYKVDLNILNNKKHTALHTAVFMRFLDIIKILVEHEADLNVQDDDGDTAISMSIKIHNRARFNKMGLAFDKDDLYGKIEKGSDKDEDIILYLAKKGAKLNIKNLAGMTPIDICLDESLKKKLMLILAEEERVKSEKNTLNENKTEKSNEENVRDLQRRLKELKEEKICVVCRSRPISIVFGCGHGSCDSCANNLLKCHMCQASIAQRIRIIR